MTERKILFLSGVFYCCGVFFLHALKKSLFSVKNLSVTEVPPMCSYTVKSSNYRDLDIG